MNGNGEKEPTFKNPQGLLRPKSLRELYALVVKTFQNTHHDEQEFLQAVIKVLEMDPIRTRSTKAEIEKEKLDFALEKSWPLNDFLHAASEYLKNRDVKDAEIKLQKLIGY